MDPIYGESPTPVTTHSIPGTIAAVDYDIGARNVAYTDEDYMNTGNGSYNSGWSYRNDGVDIEANGDENGLPYNVGWTAAGEWIGYTIEDVSAGTYELVFRVSSNVGSGIFFLELNGTNLGVISVPNTGGWWAWDTMTIPDVSVADGPQYLKLVTVQEGYNIEGFTFSVTSNSIDDGLMVEQFILGQPYPNPFNPSMMIDISVNESGIYSANVFDLNGKIIAEMYSGILEVGEHSLTWDGVNFNGEPVASGIYLLTIMNETTRINKKLLLVR